MIASRARAVSTDAILTDVRAQIVAMRSQLASLTQALDRIEVTPIAVHLAISGRRLGKRDEVVVDGQQSAYLTAGTFLFLLRLVSARGWIHKRDLGHTSDEGWKGASRLREELRPFTGCAILQNDLQGRYALAEHVVVTGVESVRHHWDARIRACVEAYEKGCP